jgi:rSAM/selenodomain-associated transferase 1
MAHSKVMIEYFIMSVPEALVIFAKQPDPNDTKTRLSPPLSQEEAAGLYACFLADILATAREVAGAARFIFYDPPAAEAYFAGLAPDFHLYPQSGGELGERMHLAMAELLSRGCRRVVLAGSDLPHLPAEAFQQGFAALRQGAEVVLGPSADGGYYLVGLTRPQPELFDLAMSTPEVLRGTLERIQRLNLRRILLKEEFDVDTFADLRRLAAHLEDNPEIPARSTRAWLAESYNVASSSRSIRR